MNTILYELFKNNEIKNNDLIEQNNSIKTQENDDNKIKIKKYEDYFEKFRKFIIILQKNFKIEIDNQLNQKINNSNFLFDCYLFQKLENLLSRYSLIIFFLIQLDKKEFAQNIFLLMLKQNYSYIEYLENNIISWYSISNKKINISKEIPKVSYNFLKMYSFIIKYSQYFNMMNYCNIFICRYFEIIHFIYNYFIKKSHMRGFSIDSQDQIKLWFSMSIHYVTYYLFSNYFPLNISINLNNYIKNLYKDSDENNLTNNEKKILIKTLYNLSLVYYLNGKNDRSLSNLKQVKDLILNIDMDEYYEDIITQPQIKGRETAFLEPRPFNNNTKNNKPKSLSIAIPVSENLNINNNYNDSDNVKIIPADTILKTYCKSKITLDDIQLLINYGINSGILKDNYRKMMHNFTNIMPKSPNNILQKNELKYLTIPKYFNNPLLSKIELFISEIEIYRKNYESAFDHALRAFYIIISLKLNRRHIKFNSEQKNIQKYIELISKLKDQEREGKRISPKSSFHSSFLYNYDSFKDNNNHNNKEDINEIHDTVNMDKSKNINTINNINNKHNKFEEQKNILIYESKQDKKTRNELEKFFIFLNKLNLYQIKILNESQPENSKNNDLPILFSSQFKDCLSNTQRNELDNLHTLAISRSMILKDANKWIIPNNINIGNIKGKDINEYLRKKTLKFINKYCQAPDNNNMPIRQTKEFKYFQEILKSKKCNQEIKNFVNQNFNYVIKILRKSDDNEIKEIINTPNIIMKSIRIYKKKEKRKKNCSTKEKEENGYKFNNTNNYDFDNNYDNKKYNSANKMRKSVNITFFKNHLIINEKKKRNIFDLRYSTKLYKRNNSLFPFDSKKNKKKKKGDYNDSYQDFEISIEEDTEESE